MRWLADLLGDLGAAGLPVVSVSLGGPGDGPLRTALTTLAGTVWADWASPPTAAQLLTAAGVAASAGGAEKTEAELQAEFELLPEAKLKKLQAAVAARVALQYPEVAAAAVGVKTRKDKA